MEKLTNPILNFKNFIIPNNIKLNIDIEDTLFNQDKTLNISSKLFNIYDRSVIICIATITTIIFMSCNRISFIHIIPILIHSMIHLFPFNNTDNIKNVAYFIIAIIYLVFAFITGFDIDWLQITFSDNSKKSNKYG